jgi:hypothetical protein
MTTHVNQFIREQVPRSEQQVKEEHFFNVVYIQLHKGLSSNR